MLARRRGSRGPGRELAYAGAALVGVGLLVFGSYVPHGGFYEDDWGNASLYRENGYREMALDFWLHSKPWRPVLAFLLPLPHAVFGLTPSLHLAAGLVLAILASLAFFVFLRAVGIELPHAIALALLALVFPWSDALRLWATGSLNNIAPMTYFLGAAAALHALRLGVGVQRRRVLHALSVVLYLVSLFTYEIAAPAIALSGLLYRTRVPWAALRARWLLDATIVLVWLVAVVYPSSRLHDVRSLSDRVTTVPEMVVQAASLFASMFLPRDVSSSVAKLLVLVAGGVILGLVLRRVRNGDDGELRTWLLRASAGVCAVGVGYVMFLGYGYPLAEGPENRINALSTYGFVVAAYSVVALLCLLVARSGAHRSSILLVGGILLLGLGFVDRVRADEGRYEASAERQHEQLSALRRVLPRIPPHTTVFTFGHSLTSGHGVPILDAPWVLTAAVTLRWDDPSLAAVSAVGRDVSCARDEARVVVHVAGSDVVYGARYGRAEFVDLSRPSVRHVDSRHDCREALAEFSARAR